jgi:hypothetical protein
VTVEAKLIPRMKDLIIDSFMSVRHKMNPNRRKNCFELFGFDFLVDEDFRVWLIEINTNPFLGTPNKEMTKLVPEMINDMCKIVIDPILKPQVEPENPDSNRFELIYREEGVQDKPAVNQRRSFDLDLCYPFLELKPVNPMPVSAKNLKKPKVA